MKRLIGGICGCIGMTICYIIVPSVFALLLLSVIFF